MLLYQLVKHKLISSDEASKIIENRIPLGTFYLKENEKYIAIDNSTGDAWTEEFDSLNRCLNYLDGSNEGLDFE